MGEIGTTYNNSTGAMRLWIGGNLNSNSTGHVGPTQQGTSSSSWFSEYNTNNDYYQINRIAAGGGTTSSTLFHINSAGYVGIGTTAPSKKLDVNGDVKITGDTFNDGFLQAYGSNFNVGNNNYGVFLGTYSGGTSISPGEVILSTQEKTGWDVGDGLGRIRFFLGDASGVGVRDVAKIEAVSETGNGSTSTTASGALAFYTSPYNSQVSERVRIDKDGKVGIGTTSPAEKLHIGSGASENSNLFVRVDGDAAFQKGFNIFADGSEQWRIYTTASSSDLRFYDGSNVTVTFEDGGNVGIGTTSPDGNLEIWESAVDTAASLRLTGDPDAGANTEYANIIFHSRDSNTGANGGEAQIRAYRGGDRDAPYLNFDLANTGGTLQQVMTIHGQNNAVGIGTTSPDNTLHVRSGNTNTVARFESADATARIIFQDNSGQTSIGATGDDMVFTTLSGLTERMRIKSDGNVGIGTISPSTKLQVAGTSQFDGDLTVANSTLTITAAAPNLLFTVPSGGLDSRIFNDGSGNFIIGHGTNSNTPTERLRIDSAGNVGIGTATPASKLQIISSTSGDSVLKVDGTNGTLFEVVDDLSDSLMSVNDAAGLPVFEVFADNHIVAGRYNQNDFYLDTNGYVGIGTTNPSSRLHLVSNVAVGNIFEIDNQAGNQVLRVSQASTLTALSMSDQNGAFKCGLTASSTLGGGISLSDTSGGTYLTSFASVGTVFNESGSAVDFRIEGDTDANLFFVDGSTDRIGIGTSSPTRTLHIVGAIQIDGTIDANSGAYLTSGGVWTDASSRELKKDIINLSLIKASEAVKLLNPVEFSYKATPEERRVGFIAEDVPDLVASEGRKGLSSMQIVAALTKVVQNQQKEIEWCKEQIEKLTKIK